MTRSILLACIVAIMASVLAGFFLFKQPPAAQVLDDDAWQAFEEKLSQVDINSDLTSEIFSSGIIYLPDSSGLEPVNGADEMPPFPVIKTTSTIDGVPYIYLEGEENNIVTAKQGDILESGWELKSVNLTGVIAIYGDEEREFHLVDYDLSPKPLDEAQNTGLEK